MQTLNVGAGRTDEEYKATEEQRRADLRSDCRDDANYFFWAAGLSALGTGLLPVRLNLLVSVGTVDLLTLYGRPLGPFYPLAGCGKSLNRDDSPPQGLKPSLILHDLRGAKAPLYHSAAGFRDFFRSLLGYCPKSGRAPGAPKPGEAMAPTPISPIPSLQYSRPPFVYRSG